MPKQSFVIFAEGEKVFIRTVTNYLVGEVVSVQQVGEQSFVVLKNASWIADMKRFHDCLKNGFAMDAEIEPVTGVCAVSIGSMVDVFGWQHALPDKQQ